MALVDDSKLYIVKQNASTQKLKNLKLIKSPAKELISTPKNLNFWFDQPLTL